MTNADGAFFNPTMPFVDLEYRLLRLKFGLYGGQQSGLIAFECAQVIITTINDGLSSFFGY